MKSMETFNKEVGIKMKLMNTNFIKYKSFLLFTMGILVIFLTRTALAVHFPVPRLNDIFTILDSSWIYDCSLGWVSPAAMESLALRHPPWVNCWIRNVFCQPLHTISFSWDYT